MKSLSEKGFTLIELLIVVAIVGALSSLVVASLSSARSKSQDASRIAQIRQIQTQLDLYFDTNGRYPDPSQNNCSGWNVGNATYGNFITALSPWKTPRDMRLSGCEGGYFYYRYSAGSNGCPVSKGAYYVIGFRDSPTPRTISNASVFGIPQGCTRNWNVEFDWTTGRFENDN